MLAELDAYKIANARFKKLLPRVARVGFIFGAVVGGFLGYFIGRFL